MPDEEDYGGRADVSGAETFECGGGDLLVGCGGFADGDAGCGGEDSGVDEVGGEGGKVAAGHVDNERGVVGEGS